jgi:hypothetical protein
LRKHHKDLKKQLKGLEKHHKVLTKHLKDGAKHLKVLKQSVLYPKRDIAFQKLSRAITISEAGFVL